MNLPIDSSRAILGIFMIDDIRKKLNALDTRLNTLENQLKSTNVNNLEVNEDTYDTVYWELVLPLILQIGDLASQVAARQPHSNLFLQHSAARKELSAEFSRLEILKSRYKNLRLGNFFRLRK